MKKMLLVFILLMAVVVIYFLQSMPISEPAIKKTALQHGLPWQIELNNGHSRVFGITLGSSTLADAIAALGHDYELAILAKQKEVGSLELFYSYFNAGKLQGKLVLVVDVEGSLLASLKAEALSVSMLDNGTKKYQLSAEQFRTVQLLLIRGITFAPAARLTQDMIEQRFGYTDLTIKSDEYVTHYLYPELGLDARIDDKGKDFLQYVAPNNFQAIQQGGWMKDE